MIVIKSCEQAIRLGRFRSFERHYHQQSSKRETQNTSYRATPERAMSTDQASSPLPKAEPGTSPSRLKRRHDQMEPSSTKVALPFRDTSPQRDSTTPTPRHSGDAYHSTSPTAPRTELQEGQQQTDGQLKNEENDKIDSVDPDPKVKIPDFDWADLEQRYHDMVKERAKVEDGLYKEFDSLITVGYPSSLIHLMLTLNSSTSTTG
jgi:hypothetical protein